MERIILLTGGDKKAISNYTPRSIARLGIPPAPRFWLDLLSPSERLLHRISFAFRFHPRTLDACLSTYGSVGCEDFGDYLFVRASLLEPSQKSLFIQRDLKIFLSGEYLVTIHKRSQPLVRLMPGVQQVGFNRTGSLLLTIFNASICELLDGIPCEPDSETWLREEKVHLTKNPLWWRVKNFRAALLRHFNVLHELTFVGARFFGPQDKGVFESTKAKICLLSDMVNGRLSRMEPSTSVALDVGQEKIS